MHDIRTGKKTVVEVASRHNLTVSEVEDWSEVVLAGPALMHGGRVMHLVAFHTWEA